MFSKRLPTVCTVFLFICLVFFFVTAVIMPANASGDEPAASDRIFLHEGWKLQSSCLFLPQGEQISTAGYKTNGWHSAAVPTTVVAALVADKTYPDPYYGKNLRDIPGTTYPIGKNFSLLSIPKDSPFHCSWWYRTEFTLPEDYEGRHVWLHFGGINNHANIWLNGRLVAGGKDIAGAYRTYEFDITPFLASSGPNAIAVETIAQTEKDLGINWVDWNPAPPDKDMGLWRSVYVEGSGTVAIRNPMVATHFTDASLNEADLTVEAELKNASDAVQAIYLRNVFPEMKITWGTYVNNLGHTDFPGCFRCHDGDHVSADGRSIPNDCSTCHNLIVVEEKDPKILSGLGITPGAFKGPQ